MIHLIVVIKRNLGVPFLLKILRRAEPGLMLSSVYCNQSMYEPVVQMLYSKYAQKSVSNDLIYALVPCYAIDCIKR